MMALKTTLLSTGMGIALLAGATPAFSSKAIAASFECQSAETLILTSTERQAEEHACIDVVFILDTTGSMADLIEGAKLKIWSIATEIQRAEPRPYIRFGLVAYRDRGDRYVTKQVALSDDLDAIYAELLSFEADGGGDHPESVNQALYEGIAEMDWNRSPHTLRLGFLVGDAPPHMDYPDDIQFMDTLALARDMDIQVNTLQAGGHYETQVLWKTIASSGDGYFAQIPQSGGTQNISTPYDDEIYDLQREMNETAIPYGTRASQQSFLGKLEAAVGGSLAATADRAASAYSQNESQLVYGNTDLIEEVAQGRLKVEDVDRTLLPSNLSDVGLGDLDHMIKDRTVARQNLQAQIRDLSDQRLAYLDDVSNSQVDSFDGQVKDILRRQAAEKGFRYKE